VSDLTSQQELKANYIPKEYYDTYRLVFTHYHIDKIIVRIGRSGHNQYKTNEREPYKGIQGFEYFKQIQTGNFAKQRGLAKSNGCFRPTSEVWDSTNLPRGRDRLHSLPPMSNKDTSSQHLLN
jgi:hypothetical protein